MDIGFRGYVQGVGLGFRVGGLDLTLMRKAHSTCKAYLWAAPDDIEGALQVHAYERTNKVKNDAFRVEKEKCAG